MNRMRNNDRGLLDSDGEDDYDNFANEKRALIDQQDDGDIDLFSANPYEVRQRLYKNNNELHELNTINGTKRQRDIISEPIVEYTYYDIKPGDTLHSICLRYACPLAQVKRINGLMNDQEFYGLRKIKLPLGKLGLLEEVLTSQQIIHPTSDGLTHDTNNRQKMVISPGSALSVSNYQGAKFKPLLSPGYSSDRINDLNKFPRNGLTNSGEPAYASIKSNHSHSFSSLRDFVGSNQDQVDRNQQEDGQQHLTQPEPIYVDTRQLQQHAFINTHFDTENQQTIVNGIPSTTTTSNHDNNVDKVFQDLDYHVEKAKVAAESYDQRATEIVSQIDINGSPRTFISSQRVSKIPELFFCNENFGLSYKKLLVFIFIVCLFVPLIYINQATIVTV